MTGDVYPPYSDRSLPGWGIANILMQKAFKQSPYSLTIEWVSWKRWLTHTARGDYAGTFPYYWREDREADFLFSKPFLPLRQFLWTHISRALIFDEKEDLKGRIFCQPQGYFPYGVIEEMVQSEKLKVIRAYTMSQCMKMVEQGRADFVQTIRSDAVNGAKEVGIDPTNIRRSVFMVDENGHYLMVSKKYPHAQAVIDAFNTGLDHVRKTGLYTQLIEQFSKDFPDLKP